jgi:hypothetical protein
MSQDPRNMFNDDVDYISLFDLSKSHKYSLEYLLEAAASGQLKAFKMGDQWLTTDDWLGQYNSQVKSSLDSEIVSVSEHDNNGWVSFVPNTGSRLALIPQMFIILSIFAVFSFSLSWLVFHPQGHRTALAVESIASQRHQIGSDFIYYTNGAYVIGAEAALFVLGSSYGTLDRMYRVSERLGQESIYVASVLDKDLEAYKYSDEIITQKIHEFMLFAKNKYQAVAGAEHIREQIYFDEWKESSGFEGLE